MWNIDKEMRIPARFEIRPARIADTEPIGRLQLASWRYAYYDIYPRERLDARSLDGFLTFWTDELTNPDEDSRIWVGTVDGVIAGFTHVSRNREAESDADTAELRGLWVQPEFIGQGLGRALLAVATRHIADSGFACAVLWVHGLNIRARRMYEVAGWADDGGRKLRSPEVGEEVRYSLPISPPLN